MRLKNGKKDNLALCFMQVHCETWPKWKVKDDTMTFVAQKICNLPHYKMGQGWRCNIFRGQNWVLEFLRRRTDFIWVTWNIHCPVYIRAQKWGPICNISTLGSVFFLSSKSFKTEIRFSSFETLRYLKRPLCTDPGFLPQSELRKNIYADFEQHEMVSSPNLEKWSRIHISRRISLRDERGMHRA